jgi:hypothetical protein
MEERALERKTSTIGGFGCLLTSFAMCATHYGAADLTPATLNDKMKAAGGFQAGTAYIIGGLLGSVAPGFSVDYRQAHGVPAPMAEIDSALAQNRPVIAEVDWSPSAGLQTHYVVLYAQDGSEYLAYDPYPYPLTRGKIKLTTSKYATVAGSKDPAKIITGAFFTRGSASTPPPPPPKLDKGVSASFPVYATADELALRSQTVIADYTLLKRYPINTQFKALETDAATSAKLGGQNQWLAVKGPDGTEGYTAAWLLSRPRLRSRPRLLRQAQPRSGSGAQHAPVVKTTVDGLKLRTRPDTTDATIIKMYPIGTELKVLEPATEVKRKVGTVYEWLKVVDVQGKQGVVAAWYVSIVSSGAFGPATQRQTVGPSFAVGDEVPPLVARTTEDGVALRSAPYIASDTLVVRLPIDSELIALDPPDVAAAKLGQTGEWIHVRDVRDNEGYAAAWLLKECPEDPIPGASPEDC